MKLNMQTRITLSHISRFQEYEARKSVERRARIDLQARKLLIQSKLPPRQRQYEKQFGARNQRIQTTRGGAEVVAGLTQEHTFKPKINRNVPDFERAKQAWENTLLTARQHAVPTVPQVSDLSMFSEEAQARENLKQTNRIQRRAQEELERSRVSLQKKTRC
jgi:hypothetical protein